MLQGLIPWGGKSGLHRGGRRVTPGGSNPWKGPQKTDRQRPERIFSFLVRARVKRWGKSPPHQVVTPGGTATPVRSKAKQSHGCPAR
ncbi:hypothetical protein HL41_08500 [Thermodesulfobacterium commune DSM 2178]|uniref:Uncharacterized protein n=1 Tax=Thermodesulfobacterium commune DSM 2178 TaxID=289377 RepID=A0A075WW13_9BACT|nr:hypothetical protein HL41_08500 [Thermodesulfobacterium commune DSM 2178]